MRTVLLAWQSARSDKVRSILSVIALTLGILGLVTVVSANSVLADTVTQRALMTGGKASTFRAEVAGVDNPGDLQRYGQLLQSRTNAESVTSEIWLPELEAHRDGAKPVQVEVRIVSDSYAATFPVVLSGGEWGHGTESLAPRVVLNGPAEKALGAPAFNLRSSDTTLRVFVSGVVSDGSTTPRIYLPLEENIDISDSPVFLDLSGAGLTKESLKAASTQLATMNVGMTLKQIDRIDTVSQLKGELATTSQVLVTLGVLSLGSTLFGTVNLGLATSKSRSREFALRRVLGASRRQISMVTLLESQIIACIAAAFAFALSWALFPLVVQSFNLPMGIDPPPFSPSIASISFAVSTVSALLASLVPALLSFRRDFSQVMRY